MHEMSIAINIIDRVKSEMEEHGAHRLKSLNLKIGEMTAVEPESLRFCFNAMTEGTVLEGAKLHIEEIALKGRCKACNNEFPLEQYFITACPDCGEKESDLISGKELDFTSMEVE